MKNIDPPRSEGNLAMVQARLDDVRVGQGPKEGVTIEWRGSNSTLDVIDMPVASLYYNPETHRIRAQRTLSPEKDEELVNNPWSESSQEYLHELLQGDPSDPTRRDPQFDALMDDLRENKQTEPGIITPNGILVNGNTRRAALREIGESTIRVGVLPSSWSWDDISAVELVLQLRKEYKRDYSFINFLIAVDEQFSLGRPEDQIAKEFRVKTPTLKRARWLLAFIHEAIERSRVELGDGRHAALRLVDFERDQGKLDELYRSYTKLAAKDQIAADKLREARLVAVVLGYSKTDIRFIEPDFFEKYLQAELPDGLYPVSTGDSGSVSVPGLGGISIPEEPADVRQVKTLADQVLQAASLSRFGGQADKVAAEKAAQTTKIVRRAAEKGLDRAGRDIRLRQRKQAAPERLLTAVESIDLCTEEVVAARVAGGLEAGAMEEAILSLRVSLGELAEQLQRSVKEPGEGLRWLLAGTSLEEEQVAESDD